MRARHGAPLLLILAAILATVWWLFADRSLRIEAPSRDRAAASTAEAIPEPASAMSAERTSLDSAAAVAPTPSDVDVADPLKRWLADPQHGRLIEGTIVVVDEQDREHAGEDGSFVPMAWRGNRGVGGGDRPRIVVEAGRFRMHLPEGLELGVASLELGGRPAQVMLDRPVDAAFSGISGGPRFPVVTDEPVKVIARWPRPFELRVVDAASRADVDDVQLVRLDSGPRTQNAHPGSLETAEVLLEHVRSPIVLDGPRIDGSLPWQETIWAHADSRAWGKARVDFFEGGAATIELATGSDLKVTILGTIPAPPPGQRPAAAADEERAAVLRLWPEGGFSPALEARPADSGPTRLEGIAPGRYDLSLERGRWFDKPQVLGRTRVELVAGSTANAMLTIHVKPEPARVPVAGTVILSPDWDARHLELRFEPIDVPGGTSLEQRTLALGDLEPLTDAPGRYRFRLEPLLPGRYLVACFAPAFQQAFETGPAGREDLVIAIGDPADVLVHVLDATNDRPVHAENLLLWSCSHPPESRRGALYSTKWDEARSGYAFRAPAGEIELRVAWHTGEFELAEPGSFRLEPGANELTIRVRRTTGIVISFELDGDRIAWPRDADAKMRIDTIDGQPADGAYRSPRSSEWRRSSQQLYVVPSGGSWRVVVDPLDGFEPVAPIELTLAEGEMRPLAIALRRARR